MSEAGVHFDFYFHLRGAIEDDPQRGQRTYARIEPEYTSEDLDGRPDLVLFDTSDDPVLVIEAKRPDGASGREIDPYAPAVIKQAHGYASQLGTPYFATFNGERLVLFRTHKDHVPLLQRRTKSYDIADVEPFADTLLDEIARLEADRISWDSLDDAFIERVRTLHELLAPELEDELTAKLDADSEFRESFAEWATAQGIEYDDASAKQQTGVRERFAEEGAYLLANKVLFYKILEAAPAYSDEVRPLAIRPNHARADLETYFEEVVVNIDFEAVFEHDSIYSEIPLASVGERINEFIDELDDQNLTQFDSDVIGRIYEGVIPSERRRELGEYYTPPAICDLITRLTIDEASDRVLDPACGSGGFPVSSYHRKRDLLPEPTGSHERLLNEIYGVDINRFPAHLTAINLAIQDLSSHTEDVGVEVADFFTVPPDTARFGRMAASAAGEQYRHGDGESLGRFDAVVGNPPYIRQENIDNKDRVRSHLASVGAEGLSKRSDIYSYFITYSTEFLRDGGRLGFITSDRWLDTRYGADLQKFLLDNYRIRAIIKFDAQAFEDALVGSSVIILSKEPDEEKRDRNVTKFLRVKETIEIGDIVSIVEDEMDSEQLIQTENYRIVSRIQQDLYDEEKWNVYLSAPPIYFEILAAEDIVTVGDVADVSRGITSGANNFFYANSEEFEQLGILEYTTNLLKATGQIEKIRFDQQNASEWAVLDLHELITEALSETADTLSAEPTERVKQWFASNGHHNLLEYIEWGEVQGYQDRSSFSTKDIWFDLGDPVIASILNTRFTWREHRMVWNEAGAIADQQFYMIDPNSDVDDLLLCGILNSRLAWLANELLGRRAGGEGMTRLQKTIYETERLPIPDPRKMSDTERDRIVEAFNDLMQKEDGLDEPSPGEKENERDALDRAVLATIGMEGRVDELRQAITEIVAIRERGAGAETQVLIDQAQEREVIDLAGVSDTRESTTLSDYE